MEPLLLLVALVGHAFLGVAFFDHTHCRAWPRWIVDPLTVLGFTWTLLIPVGFGLGLARGGLAVLGRGDWTFVASLGRLYLGVCWIAAAAMIARWVRRTLFGRSPAVLRHDRVRSFDLRRASGHPRFAPGELLGAKSPGAESPGAESLGAKSLSENQLPSPRLRGEGLGARGLGIGSKRDHDFLVRLPGNQMLQLDVAEKAVQVPRLAEALDRLAIVHLSDFHFTGRVGRAYFEEVVRLANQLDPDLVAITGDLVDNSECIDWIPDTLGKLTSRHGTCFILGNHDLYVDTDRLRRTLSEAGLVDLGGRWIEMRVRGQPVILAGNELPWIPPAADLEHAPPHAPDGGPLRIVLAHTPDQLRWARARDVDLLLAGHTHGGQIRFPLVGPILSATRLGAGYSSGVFHVPPTILHVTRGVSGRFPVRLNCPPEIARLVLRTARQVASGSNRARSAS